MAHLSICDTRHGRVAGWLDGWLEAVWRCLGDVDIGAIHVRYGRPRHTVRRDYQPSVHTDWLPIVPACPAVPCLSFLDMRRGTRKRCHAHQGHFSARRLRPSSVLRPPPNMSHQASRRTAPARGSRQATGSRLKLYRGFGQTAFLPNWPWGRSSHVPCSPGDSNRLESTARIPHKWRLIMAHSHVPYTPGQPG